jgi:uncharacterized protein (DUF433 family)
MVQAFSQDDVSKLVGLSRRQLDYWDQTDVISPSIASYEGRGYQRLYSFRDLIKLKVGAELRKRHMLPSRIKATIEALEDRGFADPFVTVRWVVEPDGNDVLYLDPSSDRPMSGRAPDQVAEPMDLPLRDIKTGLEATVAEHLARPTGQVTSIRNLQGSAPVIAGTRVPTAKIAGLAARGWDTQRILAAYPSLTDDDVEAALEYERRATRRRSA